MLNKNNKRPLASVIASWRGFSYKHTTVAIFIIFLTIALIDTALVTAILVWFSNASYLGAFIGGVMLVWTFTAAPGAVLLISISNNVDSLPLAIFIASIGSVLGDWVILHIINDKIGDELKPVLTRYKIVPIIRRMRRSGLKWVVMLIGAIITMLPMPDEFGVALMGISSFKRRYILMICFVLNMIGLTMLLVVGRVITGEVNQ